MKQTRKHLRSLGVATGGGHYLYRKGHVFPVIHISEDGTITRADTDLTLCKAMTVSEAYKTLEIS